MDSSNVRKTKETKNRIVVDYEGKLSFKERLKKRLSSSNVWIKVFVNIFRFVLMLGISYVILFPFVSRIAGSFMSKEDVIDATVFLIPKNFNLDIYKHLIVDNRYFEAFGNTLLLSLICAVIQTFISCVIGYGLAKFKFKGNKLVMLFVVVTMVIPHSTLELSIIKHMQSFDLFQVISWDYPGIISLLNGGEGLKFNGTYAPYILFSLTGLAFKNGLYIYMMRQFFKGVPDELEESAYVDGSGVFRTFLQIIIPLSVPMMITIFLFSFSWQWTDEFYMNLFFNNIGSENRVWLMPDIYKQIPSALTFEKFQGREAYEVVIKNTAGMLIIAPLIIIYIFGQKYLVQGIERSGLVG